MASRATASGTQQDSADNGTEPDRRTRILNAAVEYFGTMGYYGTSLQKIATKVGLTKAGVLHYVGSKEGLLRLVLTEMYDRETDAITERYSGMDRALLPAMLRDIVTVNEPRPQLVHMFSTLSAEALDPNHPAHEYFVERDRAGVDNALATTWAVPDGVDVRDTVAAALSMMDGVQLRWLREPGLSLAELWSHCENALFPLPLWEGYR